MRYLCLFLRILPLLVQDKEGFSDCLCLLIHPISCKAAMGWGEGEVGGWVGGGVRGGEVGSGRRFVSFYPTLLIEVGAEREYW